MRGQLAQYMDNGFHHFPFLIVGAISFLSYPDTSFLNLVRLLSDS